VHDIFFSYSSVDRERIRPFHTVLTEDGLDVFWDQDVPPGRDWDEWIRFELGRSRIVMTFWSQTSVKSRNVRHEAEIANLEGKQVPVMLDRLDAYAIPMGNYTQQATILGEWRGNRDDPAWQVLFGEIERRALSRFSQRRLQLKEMECRSGALHIEALRDSESRLTAQVRRHLANERQLIHDHELALAEAVAQARRAAEAAKAEGQQRVDDLERRFAAEEALARSLENSMAAAIRDIRARGRLDPATLPRAQPVPGEVSPALAEMMQTFEALCWAVAERGLAERKPAADAAPEARPTPERPPAATPAESPLPANPPEHSWVILPRHRLDRSEVMKHYHQAERHGCGQWVSPTSAAESLLASYKVAMGIREKMPSDLLEHSRFTASTWTEVQRRLAAAGHYDGEIDGSWSTGVVRALEAYGGYVARR
jgi:hypothetical protein